MSRHDFVSRFALLLTTAILWTTGCAFHHAIVPLHEPSEHQLSILPDHVIMPPDVLSIDVVTLVPRPPYLIKPLESLFIQVSFVDVSKDEKTGKTVTENRSDLIPNQPINGIFRVEPDGKVSLGFDYGSVEVAGAEVSDAKKQIQAYLKKRFKKVDFEVTVTLAESRAMQQIRGEHLVQPDGHVVLGTYGKVRVAGMTLEEAKSAIQSRLALTLVDPEISLDIAGFNSSVYYVIFDQYASGEQVHRLPVTGRETVLDAIAELKGLPPGTNRRRIWIARPNSKNPCDETILRVDWKAITKQGNPATNYQILPGDRVYVCFDPWVAADSQIAKMLAPIERIFGVTLLGSSTVRALGPNGGANGLGGGIIR